VEVHGGIERDRLVLVDAEDPGALGVVLRDRKAALDASSRVPPYRALGCANMATLNERIVQELAFFSDATYADRELRAAYQNMRLSDLAPQDTASDGARNGATRR
jgi:hypothetical protein